MPVGLLLVALATMEPLILHPFNPGGWFQYVYAAGAVLLLLCRLFITHGATDLRLRRLYRMEGWSAIFFCAAAFFMWYPGSSPREWLAFTLAGATIRIIVFVRGSIAARKKA